MVLNIQNKPLKEAIEFFLSLAKKMKLEPVKLVFKSTGKTLYANTKLLRSFVNDGISLSELIADTSCIDLYRNIEDIETHNQTIDKGSLWIQLDNQTIILKDDDQYVEIDFNQDLFEVV